MKYWLIPILFCAGVAQAHAGQAGGSFAGGLVVFTPSFIGTNISSKPLSATAGVQLQQNNNLNVQQNSLVDFVGVQQVSLGKAGSSQSNTATVGQYGGPAQYVGLGQHIESLPPMPSIGGP